MKHIWEDVSYHGSPIYQCKNCDLYEDDVISEYCPSSEALKDIKLQKEERSELRKLILYRKRVADTQDRYEYLMNKYNGR